MPKIKIVEKDNTGSSQTSALTTVIYVPCLCTTSDTTAIIEPTLCTSTTELDALTQTATGRTGILSTAKETGLAYRIARYLINNFGFYVLVEGFPSSTTSVPSASWTRLTDTNNYQITFLTTGQFKTVDSSAAACAGKRGDCVYVANYFDTIASASKDVYTLETAESTPTGWPTNYYSKTAAGSWTLITDTTTVFAENTYYLKVETGTTTVVTSYNILVSKPANWTALLTDNKIYIPDTSEYTAVASGTTYAANTYYLKTSETKSWAEAVRDKFTVQITSNDTYVGAFAPTFITETSDLLFKSETEAQTEASIPAGFGFLFTYGRLLEETYPWIAAAGSQYGQVNEVSAFEHYVTSSEAEVLQARAVDGEVELDAETDNVGQAINPICEVKPFGNIVWGYRTMRDNNRTEGLKATSFLNIRILLGILKKYLRQFARKYTFQQNDEFLWTNFKNDVTTILDGMKVGRGIYDYTITKVATTAKARLKATITIVPIEPVEDFDVEIDLEVDLEDSITVSE